MSLGQTNYEARFHVLENLLIDMISDFTQKLSQLTNSEVLFLAQSNAIGRRVAGSHHLCQSFLNGTLLPDGSEVDLSTSEEPILNCSPQTINLDASINENGAVPATAPPPPPIPSFPPPHLVPLKPNRKRAACTSGGGDGRPALKVSRLPTAVKMEALDSTGIVDAVVSEEVMTRIVMDGTEEETVGKLLNNFLNSSSKAEAIRQSSDPSVFAKSSVMYKLFSSLIWDYSKECAKVLPFDDNCKPLLSSFAFDVLWNFFPAFEFYDNSPSINSGGCFRSPRGFFKNMFCNRLKDQTTRKKR